MRILITGGTGLIGRALCGALLEAGHQVTVLSRFPQSVHGKCGPNVSIFSGLDQWSADTAFDAVINLAGAPIVDAPWTAARRKMLWDSRVTLTERLVEKIAASRTKPAVLLSGSAIGFYGDCGDDSIIESHKQGSDFAAQLCAAWEAAAQQASAAGVRVCLLRTGVVLSASGGFLERMPLPFKLGLGARLGNGRQSLSWIHIDDFVAMTLKMLDDTRASGAINMAAPQPVTNNEFTQKLAAALHRPAFLAAPGFVIKAIFGARSILLLGGQRVLPEKLQSLGYRFKFAGVDEALKEVVTALAK
ncbi:MAG TPA: TIGR01777 family oxidoreductase [Burkholderiaceae bacterium]|jgi:hypothetical protein